MLAVSLAGVGFRNLVDARIELGPGLTVAHGPNGAGKTNLLEALYFGLTGRSCRTRRERELIRFGLDLARAEVQLEPEPGEVVDSMTFLGSVSHADGRNRRCNRRPVTPEDDRSRPAVSVFMPDRLALVKGPPSPRRAHLDRVAAAVWPARAGHRLDYSKALAQRNALLTRVRKGGDPASLDAWDHELARRAVPLVEARSAAADLLSPHFTATAEALGLPGLAGLRYRPRTDGRGADEIASELSERRDADLSRGFTGWGPHRDEVDLSLGDRAVRQYGSQGQQRLSLLALLFAERAVLEEARRSLPLMLLDDVMSELDPERRGRLVALLAEGGQALITATESGHVPESSVGLRLEVEAGEVSPG